LPVAGGGGGGGGDGGGAAGWRGGGDGGATVGWRGQRRRLGREVEEMREKSQGWVRWAADRKISVRLRQPLEPQQCTFLLHLEDAVCDRHSQR
jgi:hypothetical protein